MKINNIMREIICESLVTKFERFIGGDLKIGRMVIKGIPVDVDDSDGSYLEMDAVDSDAAKDLIDMLKKAKFKVRKYGKTGIVIEE